MCPFLSIQVQGRPAAVVIGIPGGAVYTAQFLNPTSTPVLIVDRHGTAHPLPFGIKSAADLFKAVDIYLHERMYTQRGHKCITPCAQHYVALFLPYGYYTLRA